MSADKKDSEKVKQAALELLPELRKEVSNDEHLKSCSDECLLRFLYWKPSVSRAKERLQKLYDYATENSWAFGRINDDPTLKRTLENEVMVCPTGMLSTSGHPVLIGKLRNNDMSDGRTSKDVVRMALYTVDRLLEDPIAQTQGVIIFHDLRGLARNNLDPGVPKLLFSALIGHFPLRIAGIYILDAPFFFKMMFQVVSLMMPKKLRDRTNFVSSFDDIPINKEDMLVEHGGKRQWNQQEWVELQMQREKEGSQTSILDSFDIKTDTTKK